MKENEVKLDAFCDRKSFYGKCGASVNDGVITLRSYTTRVATYNISTGEFTKNYEGDGSVWSMTTKRHFKAFVAYCEHWFHNLVQSELDEELAMVSSL